MDGTVEGEADGTRITEGGDRTQNSEIGITGTASTVATMATVGTVDGDKEGNIELETRGQATISYIFTNILFCIRYLVYLIFHNSTLSSFSCSIHIYILYILQC